MTAWTPLLTTKGKESVRLTLMTKIWLNYPLFYQRIRIPKKVVSIFHSKFNKTEEVQTFRVGGKPEQRARLTEFTENYFPTTHCQFLTLKSKPLTAD